MRTIWLAGMAAWLGWASALQAAVQTRAVAYTHEDAELEGFLAWDDAVDGPRPGVLVFHAWMGLGDFARDRARELAGLGYVAFAVDMYGPGNQPQNRQEAAALSGGFKADRARMRGRAQAGMDVLAGNELCAGQPVAAIGYCFGGTVALELARSGAPLAGAVSFHGNLDTPDPDDAQQIRGAVLALHGADDPYVPPEEVQAFQDEMRAAGVDWQLVMYGGAVHAFTEPAAGDDPSRGAAYHPAAARRSWQAMKDFLAEVFSR